MQNILKKYILVSAIVLVLVIAGALTLQRAPRQSEPTQTPDVATSLCPTPALTVTSPTKGALVSTPITLSAIVDNRNQSPSCAWTVFEAQAGTVTAIDTLGNQVGAGILSTTDEWMTTSPVTYTATVDITGKPETNNIALVITEENPSGEGTPKTITTPVTFQ